MQGSGCGSVGSAVAFNSRDPRFESRHWENFIDQLYNRKDKNKEKEAGNLLFLRLQCWPLIQRLIRQACSARYLSADRPAQQRDRECNFWQGEKSRACGKLHIFCIFYRYRFRTKLQLFGIFVGSTLRVKIAKNWRDRIWSRVLFLLFAASLSYSTFDDGCDRNIQEILLLVPIVLPFFLEEVERQGYWNNLGSKPVHSFKKRVLCRLCYCLLSLVAWPGPKLYKKFFMIHLIPLQALPCSEMSLKLLALMSPSYFLSKRLRLGFIFKWKCKLANHCISSLSSFWGPRWRVRKCRRFVKKTSRCLLTGGSHGGNVCASNPAGLGSNQSTDPWVDRP